MKRALISTVSLLGITGCGLTYTTIPEPFVRPGSPIFYLKTMRQTEREVSTYKGSSVATTIQETRYTAVDLASCRRLGTVTVPGQTWEVAWDAAGGDDLWFSQGIKETQARSFRGGQATLPTTFVWSGNDWPRTSTLRLLRAQGTAPSVWDFHTRTVTPVPDEARALAGSAPWILAGARRLMALAPNEVAGGDDVLVVEPGDDGPPRFVRETMAVVGLHARPFELSPNDGAIVFTDASGLVEAFDLSGGRKLWATPTPEYGIIGGGRSPEFTFRGPVRPLPSGFLCSRNITLIALTPGALLREITSPGCVQGPMWVDGGRFLIESIGDQRHDQPNTVLDTETGRFAALPANLEHPVAVGGVFLYDDGDRDGPFRRRQLFKVDFQRGAGPVEGFAGDIRFVVADPVSGTVIVSAAPDEVLVYRAATGRLEQCVRP